MKNGFTVFLASFFVLGSSWTAFVLGSAIQLGHEKQTTVLNGSDAYPVQRAGEATLGLQVYRASGCAACHTEQVQQNGMACDVILTAAGKNAAAVSNLVAKLKLSDLSEEEAAATADKITAAGGKVETRIIATGGDIARGWGIRHSVAADYLYDYPVQLGSLRVGPDLGAIGVRMADVNLQLQHLYAPKSVNAASAMPPFRFLFEVRKVGTVRSPEALNLPKEFAPADGYEVVPKPEARQLVAYLLSLRADVPLYEAPFTPATPKK
ncbi:MAG TPA: cbb3-type cytochrome c oxidase subunit II [Verrucomicrobiae bacterium]